MNGWTSLRLHTEALQNCGVLSTLCTPTLVAEVASPLQPNTNMHKHVDTHLAGYKRLPTLSPWGLRDPKQSAEPWDVSKFLSGALMPQARKERLDSKTESGEDSAGNQVWERSGMLSLAEQG